MGKTYSVFSAGELETEDPSTYGSFQKMKTKTQEHECYSKKETVLSKYNPSFLT